MNQEKAATETLTSTNDQVRQTLMRDRLYVTSGVHQLGDAMMARIFAAIETYEDFTPANDPHGEHDFGVIEIDQERIFWKLDYFDNAREYHSPDVLNRSVTKRVLTVMLADEY